jgi:hypothetical protein
MSISPPAWLRLRSEAIARPGHSLPRKSCKILSRVLPSALGQLSSREGLRKSQQGASRAKNSWNAAFSSHGERMRNRGCSQAWAEFCIAYCKRLSLLLAIPAIKIGCSDGALRFMVLSGNGPDRFLRKLAAEAALARSLSAPLFHSEKVA